MFIWASTEFFYNASYMLQLCNLDLRVTLYNNILNSIL